MQEEMSVTGADHRSLLEVSKSDFTIFNRRLNKGAGCGGS